MTRAYAHSAPLLKWCQTTTVRNVTDTDYFSNGTGLVACLCTTALLYKKGPRRAPKVVQLHFCLEGEFAYDCNRARVAGKYRLRVVENRVTRREIVQITRAEQVGELRAEAMTRSHVHLQL